MDDVYTQACDLFQLCGVDSGLDDFFDQTQQYEQTCVTSTLDNNNPKRHLPSISDIFQQPDLMATPLIPDTVHLTSIGETVNYQQEHFWSPTCTLSEEFRATSCTISSPDKSQPLPSPIQGETQSVLDLFDQCGSSFGQYDVTNQPSNYHLQASLPNYQVEDYSQGYASLPQDGVPSNYLLPITTTTTSEPEGSGAMMLSQNLMTSRGSVQVPNWRQIMYVSSIMRTTSRRRRKRIKGQRLWEFILDILDKPEYSAWIRWLDIHKGIFIFVDSKRIAQLWGSRKQKKTMSYEYMSRALRHYYKPGILRRIKGRRLVYQFLIGDFLQPNQAEPQQQQQQQLQQLQEETTNYPCFQ